MRGGRTEKRRGGGVGKRSSSSGSRKTFRDVSRRPHARGRLSKHNASSKNSRAAPNSSASKGVAFHKGHRGHSKMAKKIANSQHQQADARQQPVGAEHRTRADVTRRGRETEKLRTVAESLKRRRKKEMQRGGSSCTARRAAAPASAEGAAAGASPGERKQQQQQQRKRFLLHGQAQKKKQQQSGSGGRRRVKTSPDEDKGSCEPPKPRKTTQGPPRASAGGGSAAAAAHDTGAETDASKGAENAVSVSKKRKLEAEKKLSSRNQDAGYIKQCFRLYGQLLAAPRSGREEETSAVPLANGDEKPKNHTGKDAACSASSSSKRSPAVQKAAAALYDFILPRVKEKDRHLCTSRSIQMLLKYGSNEQRKALWQLLKSEFSDLCMGRNSCQLAMKLYLYGDAACQEEIMQLLKDPKQGKPVFFSKFGARVWEYVYTAAKSEKLQTQMLRSIVLPPLAVVRHPEDSESLPFPALFDKFDAETKKLTLDHLAGVVQSCVDKELLDKAPVHKLLQYYTVIASPERLQEVMDVTGEGFLRLASTKSGVEAMTTLSGFATAKQRKTLIKELKKHVVSMAKNAVDCVFVLRLLCTVDDTRLLRDGVLQPLLGDVRGLIVDAYGQLILLQLLEDSAEISRYLPPDYRRLLKLPSPTSLKPMETRMSELRQPVLEALEAAFMSMTKGPEDGSGTATAVADSEWEGNDDENFDGPKRPRQQHLRAPQKPEFTLSNWFADPKASRILTKFFYHSTSSDVFSALVTYFAGDVPAALAHLDHPQVQRFLSGLAKQMEPSTTESLPTGDELTVADSRASKTQAWEVFLKSIWERLLKPHLVHVLPTRGVFVVSDVLEAARRLAFKDLEDDIIGSLDSNVLSEARAKLLEKGVNPVGLEILASKRLHESTKPQL